MTSPGRKLYLVAFRTPDGIDVFEFKTKKARDAYLKTLKKNQTPIGMRTIPAKGRK